MGGYTLWIFLGVMIVLLGGMWFFNNRRYKKQQQEREEKMNALSVGDKIVTIGMIVGEIIEKKEDGTFVLKTGNEENVGFITIREAAIYQIINKDQDDVFAEPDLPAAAEETDKETKEDVVAEEEPKEDDSFNI